MSAPGAESLNTDKYPPPDAPQDSVEGKEEGASQAGRNLAQVVPPVATNIFTRTLQNTLGLSKSQVWVLTKDGYYTHDKVLYWKLTDIRYWCKLKDNIHVRCRGLSFVYR